MVRSGVSEVCSLATVDNGYALIDKNYEYPKSIKPYFSFMENSTCTIFHKTKVICH